MKKNILAMLFCTCCIAVHAQELIGTAGEFNNNSSGSITYSVGETLTETFSNNNVSLTQGMQQPELTITTLVDNPSFKIDISAFPNPATTHVVLKISDVENISFSLFDINGKLLMSKKIDGNETQIPFLQLSPASYILKITKNNQEIKTYTIVKNKAK